MTNFEIALEENSDLAQFAVINILTHVSSTNQTFRIFSQKVINTQKSISPTQKLVPHFQPTATTYKQIGDCNKFIQISKLTRNY